MEPSTVNGQIYWVGNAGAFFIELVILTVQKDASIATHTHIMLSICAISDASLLKKSFLSMGAEIIEQKHRPVSAIYHHVQMSDIIRMAD